jgi:glycogen debranching enzyme
VRNEISILDGSTFLVCDRRGDIDASPSRAQGLFYRDTRFLSRWTLRADGQPLDVLSTDETQYFSAQFFLVPPGGDVNENPSTSMIRKRSVGDGFHEDITVINHAPSAIELELRLEADSDFADLFEVKDALAKKGLTCKRVDGDTLVLGYRRDDFVRETRITVSQPCTLDEDGFTFRLELAPHSEWNTCVFVQPVMAERALAIKYGHGEEAAKPDIGMSLEQWLAAAPRLHSDWDPLEHIYERSLVDLAALRFSSELFPGQSLPAAGLPWFMTVFGRDSLITSYQALPFAPDLAATTVRVLARYQGTKVDPFRDEAPGKILHEIRFGELTHFEERPHSPYYGAADTTPLFLIVLDELERWTGDAALVRELELAARAALAYLDEYGDIDGDGYVEYQRAQETGLENQCWKDSPDSIRFADGTVAKGPIATCEIQGYVYDAKLRAARLAREFWDDAELAERLEREAAELRSRFDRDFWLPARGHHAIALDGDKRPVDSLTSNVGHLLWSGIVLEERAEALAQLLVGERLFSGWGVRTMAEGEGGYNPIRYHNGTVWPHDNSLIAAGLARYGLREEAATIAFATLEAATYFRYRLPEVFAGYRRGRTGFPVEYPTASSPQAWATGAPLLLLRTLLGLEPCGDELRSDPWLPEAIGRIELTGIPGRWGRVGVSTAGMLA